jgi:hypothetical protein
MDTAAWGKPRLKKAPKSLWSELESEWDLAAGYESFQSLPEGSQKIQRPYLGLGQQGTLRSWQWHVELLARRDRAKDDPSIWPRKSASESRHGEVRPEQGWLAYQGERHRWQIGLQTVSWGETFGFPIMDIVNPTDGREPYLLSPERRKLSSWLLQYQWFGSQWNLQLLASPWPTQQVLADGEPASWEGGGRLGYLTEDGFEWKLMFYHHRNRQPLVSREPILDENQKVRILVTHEQREEDSYGLTFTKDVSGFVVRGDGLYVPLHHLQGQRQPEESERAAGIVGVDHNFGEDWFLGLQFYSEALLRDSSSQLADRADMAGLQMIYPFVPNRFQIKVFSFLSANNRDYWLHAEWSQFLGEHLQGVLAYDQLRSRHPLLAAIGERALYYRVQWSW